MKRLRVEPLSARFSIVKDHLWCIYDGDLPLFHGSASECRDWLDRNEALQLHQTPTDHHQNQPSSLWGRLVRLVF